MKRLAVAVLLAAAPAAAQDLPPAPDYFVRAVFETTTAQSLALACPTLSFELRAASLHGGEVMARLAQDGFDTSSAQGIAVSGFEEALEALRAPFVARHDLEADPSNENACRAGMAEIAAGTGIARFLLAVGQ
jgi:hypothetical protein